eukprot:12073495-Ditylum_brightwellii.AAC.1
MSQKWKCHIRTKKKIFYHGLCHHGTDECNIYKASRKHVQPTHCIMEEQRLRQVCFVKNAERHAKKCSFNTKETKDLKTFVKDKVDEMIK